jgi:hypothetical protein
MGACKVFQIFLPAAHAGHKKGIPYFKTASLFQFALSFYTALARCHETLILPAF